MERNRNCKECGDLYEAVRLDQRFCKQQCRNRYNNRRYRQKAQDTKKIDAYLHKNHQLLKHFGDSKQSVRDMKLYGFNFKFYTNIELSSKRVKLYYVYDMGFYLVDKNQNVQIFTSKNK